MRKSAAILVLVSLISALVEASVHARLKRQVVKEKGSDELKSKSEAGYSEYYTAAKAAVKGEWMSKDVIIAKYWRFWGRDALDKIQKASDWRTSRKDLPITDFEDISNQLQVDTRHKDRDGRVILYQHNGKPPYIENSKDPAKVAKWRAFYTQMWQEASEKQLKKFDDQKTEFATITILANYDGFNKEVYLCPVCVQFGKDICEDADNYFPNMVYKAFLVNAAPEFDLFWKLVRITLSESTRERDSKNVLGGRPYF